MARFVFLVILLLATALLIFFAQNPDDLDPEIREYNGTTFRYYPNKDSKGSDIQQDTGAHGDVDLLMERCVEKGCAGFTVPRGFIKSSIKPSNRMENLDGGLWVRVTSSEEQRHPPGIDRDAGQVAGFLYPGTRRPGGDISWPTIGGSVTKNNPCPDNTQPTQGANVTGFKTGCTGLFPEDCDMLSLGGTAKLDLGAWDDYVVPGDPTPYHGSNWERTIRCVYSNLSTERDLLNWREKFIEKLNPVRNAEILARNQVEWDLLLEQFCRTEDNALNAEICYNTCSTLEDKPSWCDSQMRSVCKLVAGSADDEEPDIETLM